MQHWIITSNMTAEIRNKNLKYEIKSTVIIHINEHRETTIKYSYEN